MKNHVQFSEPSLLWLSAILQERFGAPYIVTQPDLNRLILRLPGSDGAIIFCRLDNIFHQSRSDFECYKWCPESEGLRSATGHPLPAPCSLPMRKPIIEVSERQALIHYDILGLVYWMLTRHEEVGRTDLDSHGRFPATSSHAFKHGYLERPIVDEWLHVLGQVIERVWPGINLKRHQFNIKVSHDVDRPSRYGFSSAKQLCKSMLGDILKRGDLRGAIQAPWIRFNTRSSLHPEDGFNTFDWIMSESEKHNLRSAFYFICGRTDVAKDGDYEIEHPAIRNLIRHIHDRGHEIGLHPSYNTYQRADLIAQEFRRLRAVCAEEGVEQDEWGGRMHYLRWEHPATLQAWDEAGLNYDSTLGYADHPGFRCGTCFEYPSFDTKKNTMRRLRIRPLIAMECTVIASRYLGLGCSQMALDKLSSLKDACRSVGGSFTLLWHNTQLVKKSETLLYRRLIAGDRNQ